MADQDSEDNVNGQIEREEGEITRFPANAVPAQSDTPVEMIVPERSPVRQIQFHASWVSIAIWAALIVLLVAFFAFGSVTTYPQSFTHPEMRVDHVWALFRDDLPNVSSPTLLSVIFYCAIGLMVIGMAWMIFLALGTRSVERPNEAGSPAPNSSSAASAADVAPPRF